MINIISQCALIHRNSQPCRCGHSRGEHEPGDRACRATVQGGQTCRCATFKHDRNEK